MSTWPQALTCPIWLRYALHFANNTTAHFRLKKCVVERIDVDHGFSSNCFAIIKTPAKNRRVGDCRRLIVGLFFFFVCFFFSVSAMPGKEMPRRKHDRAGFAATSDQQP
jgi:hypothetical protein